MKEISLTSLSIGYLIFFLTGCQSSSSEMTRKENSTSPNVLIILTDDQGWGDLHYHGNDSLHTPVLDNFARNSIYLERFYVSPVCAPTRAALLTGRYPLKTGVSGVTNRREVMRSEEVTIAELLKSAGYTTGIFGKWHNGEQYPNDPIGQGFDHFFGFTAGHWNNYFNTQLNYNGEMMPTKGYINDVLTDSALHFMAQHQDSPFLCYTAYNTPHSPFQVPDSYFTKYKAMGFDDKNASVYGMVENLDYNIGRFFKSLDSLGIADNTIVIFFTDNGPNGHRFNGGMKGVKGWVDEGGVRVPFFLSYPGRYSEGLKLKQIAAHIDILPTLMDLCQVDIPDSLDLDGKSLVPLFDQVQADWPERQIFSYWANKGSVRNQQYRLVVQNQDTMLYDMYHDPGQHRNIAIMEREVSQQMKKAYQYYIKQFESDKLTKLPVQVGYHQAPVVSLPAHEADLHGSLQYKEGHGWANDWIVNWQDEEDYASWPLEVVAPARYSFTLLYDTPQGQEGSVVRVRIGDQSVTTKISEPFAGEYIESPDRVKRQEVYEKEWGLLKVGDLDLVPGKFQLMIQAEDVAQDQVMDLKGVLIEKMPD
ncbi:MAG: arylsulfatase [Candidatus Cyclobacteriaceae bacterium M3_2C_046]